ncbi:MAG: LLM class flavin-dependent oxidoreductase [Acidimicrobiales bacterium]
MPTLSDPSKLRVGVSSPWNLFEEPVEEQRRQLDAIVDAGIDHLFMADHVSFRGGGGNDVLVHLAALAGLEPRLGLYAGVYLLALRHPMVAARQIATLASIAPGRLTMGVGVGGEDRHEFEVCGIDPSTRGRRTDSELEIVRRLLAGDTVDRADEFFTLESARILPVPNPSVPFVVGGRSVAAIERAGRLGDGWLAAWTTPQRFAEGIERATVAADAAGRQSVAWRHGYQIWVGIGGDRADARRHVAEAMSTFYRMPFEPFEKFTPVGTAAQVAEQLAPFVAAGALDLNITPCGPDRATEIAAVAEIKRLLAAD